MRKLLTALLLVGLGAVAGFIAWEWLEQRQAPRLFVTLPEAGGLEDGDPVTLAGIEIGRVEAVEVEGDHALAALRLDRHHAASLPSDLTFKVETTGLLGRGRVLVAHVLDPESPPVADGSRVEGVGSSLELAVKVARRKLEVAAEEASQSPWAVAAKQRFDDAVTDLRGIDWGKASDAAKDQLASLTEKLGDASARGEAEAKRRYRELEPEIEKAAKELERIGESERARRLRKRLEDVWKDKGAPEAPAPLPSTPAAPSPPRR
jgi:ABC-type transporter Mla subunit MlaD